MKYPYSVYQMEVEGHLFWVAECSALKGCVGQGETSDEAVKELEGNVEVWLETAIKYGIAIPEVPVKQCDNYSGKFTVRIAPFVHQEASKFAESQGVSLSQYVSDAIVAQNSRLSTIGYISPEVKKAVSEIRESTAALSSSSGQTKIIDLKLFGSSDDSFYSGLHAHRKAALA